MKAFRIIPNHNNIQFIDNKRLLTKLDHFPTGKIENEQINTIIIESILDGDNERVNLIESQSGMRNVERALHSHLSIVGVSQTQ